MIGFLFKRLIRDRSRSRLPLLVVTTGVALTILLHAYITGLMGETIEMNVRFLNGHLKVTTKAYAGNITQIPNDLALVNVNELLNGLNQNFTGIEWSPRIHFGGLIDVPDEQGETKSQGPAAGMGIDLLTPGSAELQRLNLDKSLVRGSLPVSRGEALLSEEFSQKLRLDPGEQVTLISSTMNGSMSFYNFLVSGTVSFGQEALDRGSIIADIEDVRYALNMEDAAGEIVGFLKGDLYDNELALREAEKFASIQKSMFRSGKSYMPGAHNC